MTMIRKALAASAQPLSELRQVRVICSTSDVDRMGETVMQAGIDLKAFNTNPVILWQHDPAQPIARAVEIGVQDGVLKAVAQFPPAGASPKADEIYSLICADVVRGVSIGFDPKTMRPADGKTPYGPQIYDSVELVEFSFVSIPAIRGALVLEKSVHRKPVPTLSRKAAALRLRLAILQQPPAPVRRTLSHARAAARIRALETPPAPRRL